MGDTAMTMKVYGGVRSRAAFVMWTAKELGVPCEQVEITHDQMKQADYLAINPYGKVPALVDGDLKMSESYAINLYLAKKYGLGKLYPSSIEDEAKVWQWTMFAATEVEPAVMPVMLFRVFERGDAATADAAEQRLLATLKVADTQMTGREYLVGDRFSVADINLAAIMQLAAFSKIDFSGLTNLKNWFDRCQARSAKHMGG
jgi:glutathione S-transferase